MSQALMYSDGIQIIVDEHAPLRKQMGEIREMALQLEKEPEQLKQLHSAVSTFTQQVEIHSKAEDEILSPLLGKYLGMDAPPVAGNAAQHQGARRLLKQYQDEFSRYSSGDQSRLSSISESLVEAVKVLTEHFDFEEANLFPLAERTLSSVDKEELLAKLKSRG
ncbi:hemerythrin domain-containing protein [Ammoniphilus resinae]|uniref:Hemerythrin-like domain-containing protein n=1 Tax=Ammoniphilus resinae TaxID=861532 RepID=A0ABS4GS86_9BACL|nr:hemerythrin domain-containing protein [Ammoniphilus resinae]MBP1933111.1 hemerythrin-like domain-containing protein [Ammoniphilus resinae]